MHSTLTQQKRLAMHPKKLSKLRVQPGFTIGPPEFQKHSDQTVDTGSGFYFCMKAT